MKKIGVMANKGGVSKTTTVTSIASILSQDAQNKVLLVDGDAQGSSLITYGRNPVRAHNTLYDVLLGGVHINETVISISKSLDILPSNSDMDYLDQDVWSEGGKYPFPFMLLSRALNSQIRGLYTHVIFDSSPSMNLINMNILHYVESVIIPFELEETALKGIVSIMERIENIDNDELKIGALLPVKVEARANLHQSIYKEVESFANENDLLLFKGIPKTVKFAESVTKQGKPAVEAFKNNRAVKKYYDFVEELIKKGVL